MDKTEKRIRQEGDHLDNFIKENETLIISSYGKVLEEKSSAGEFYSFEDNLPYEKPVIALTLIRAIIKEANQELKGHLITALMSLFNFIPTEKEYKKMLETKKQIENLQNTIENLKKE